jgi:DNA-binding CsgD family transcriptional regulator/tetratricopeptide (TPR) repeat protein
VQPLLEREEEEAAIRAAAADAAAGHGRLVVVEGAAGIGKSSLLDRVPALVDRTLTARGSDLESQFPYGVVRQLFEPVLDERLLAGAARQAAPVFGAGEGATSEMATLHGLHWLTANLAEAPAALVVDDLHWVDAASLRYLAYLAPRLDGLPLLVVAATRAGVRGVDDALLGRLLTDPSTTLLHPAPLTAAGSAELLAAAVEAPVDPAFADACFRATAGNPLLLRALARAVRADGLAPDRANAARVLDFGPRAVARLVGQRTAGMTTVTRDVARALAVLGQDAPLPAVRTLAGVDALTVAEAVAELDRLGLVEVREDRASYVHPLVAAAVDAELGVRERALAHGRAADVLAAAGAAPELVAAHLLKVPPAADPTTVERLRAAARAAIGRGSPEAAFAFLRRCLAEELEPAVRAAVLADAAEVAVQVDLPAAAGLVDEALRHARGPVEAARIGMLAGAARGFLHDPEGAAAALIAARDGLPAAEDDLRRRIEATLLVGAFIAPGEVSAGRLAGLAALPPADGIGARMLTAAVAAHQMTRRDPAAAARAREALDDGVLVRAVNGEGALVAGWLTLIAAGDPLGLSSLDDAVALAHRQGSLRALSAAYCFRALGRLWYGRLAEAEEDAREALRMTETGRVDLDVSFAGAYLADALVHQGRLDEAERVLAGIGVPAADPFDRPRYYALESWAELLLVSGRPAEARRAAEEAGRVWRAYGFDNPAVGAWRTTAGMAAHRLGETDAAAALLRAEVGLAREWGAARPLGRALRALGTATGDVAALREAVDLVADGAGGRLERAYARFALGAHLRRAGARTEARDLFGLALDEADVCGAGLLAGWVAGELRVAGYRPRRNRITGRSALTPSELRVAELAAGGATNREIAQALYVTTKTVEVHLSSAYRKLGVAGRPGLSAALG